jgi:hypothetical protein
LALLLAPLLRAGVGDPQLKTDHPWYPGELSCSNFNRLFKTEAELYQRVTGRAVKSDEDKALAAWYWRNLHYAHGEEGERDCFTGGFSGATTRDYWTGLFADGFALCGTTHGQWCAEMDALLGHCRSRVVGVEGHNSFEVYLTGGPYGAGRWVLLDHDISTVIFNPEGTQLLGLHEIVPNVRQLADPFFKPERQHAWRVSGLHDDDARGSYTTINSVEYLAGYAGPPPMVHLRSGESLRRYPKPGLEDGKTFVFWGRNYMTGGIPGPSRDRTWVNQPQNMYGSKTGTGSLASPARFANAVYTYHPDFAGGSYKQGVVEEAADHVTFEFYSPYVIAAAPPNHSPWGVYDSGCKKGLVVRGKADCPVRVSVDQGVTWHDAGKLGAAIDRAGAIDLTDAVNGYQQYLLRFDAGAAALKNAGLSWQTVCEANAATIPHLHDGENTITYAASGRAIVSVGPSLAQAQAHVADGKLDSDSVTLKLVAPRGAKPAHLYAASWQASGNPPAEARYRIDYSLDEARTWQPAVKDWSIVRRPPEPADIWSQSFTWTDAALDHAGGGVPVWVRFSNSGHKAYRRVEAHLAYDIGKETPTRVTFAWTAGGILKTASHSYRPGPATEDSSWRLQAGSAVDTRWVEFDSE